MIITLPSMIITNHEACIKKHACQYVFGFYPYFDFFALGHTLDSKFVYFFTVYFLTLFYAAHNILYRFFVVNFKKAVNY